MDIAKLIIATHNQGKLREIRSLFVPFGIECVSAGELGFEEPEETENTFVGNARIKAHFAAKQSGLPALADDSGICVDALDGAPGVYTADWAETENGRDFVMAMTTVYEKVLATGTAKPWTASFNCVLCLAFPDGSDLVFTGKANGSLTWPMRGEQGFGFDPMFVPERHDRTFGEMPYAEKEPLTHRADAFEKLTKYFEDAKF